MMSDEVCALLFLIAGLMDEGSFLYFPHGVFWGDDQYSLFCLFSIFGGKNIFSCPSNFYKGLWVIVEDFLPLVLIDVLVIIPGYFTSWIPSGYPRQYVVSRSCCSVISKLPAGDNCCRLSTSMHSVCFPMQKAMNGWTASPGDLSVIVHSFKHQ